MHKDNELCNKNFDHILTVDTTSINDHLNDENLSVFLEDLDEDSDDLEIDLEVNFSQNVDQEKKRTRRKYTKNKNNGPSNLICESKTLIFLKSINFINLII